MHRISSRELTEWYAFERVYGPIGYQRDDYLAGMIAHRIASMLTDAKTSKRLKVEQFVPKWDNPPPLVTEDSRNGDHP